MEAEAVVLYGKIVKVLESSGLPQDALIDCARVTLTGRSLVTIEGQHGVVELADQRIRMKTGGGMLLVTGEALALNELSPVRAVITGEMIESVSYR